MHALRRRYGRAEGADHSLNPTVIEYGAIEMMKGKSPAAAARTTAKKLSGSENLFIAPGQTTVIDPKALEAALWNRLADFAAKGAASFKAGKEHWALGGTIQHFHQKPSIRAQLKEVVIKKLGHDPFPADDGT